MNAARREQKLPPRRFVCYGSIVPLIRFQQLRAACFPDGRIKQDAALSSAAFPAAFYANSVNISSLS